MFCQSIRLPHSISLIMELYARVEQVLSKLRPAFSREVPFEWFALLLWGVLLSHQPAAVTSYLNGLNLSEAYYGRALHWFNSRAFRIDEVCQRWGRWLSAQAQVVTKVEAFERSINLNAIVFGLLPVLVLDLPNTV